MSDPVHDEHPDYIHEVTVAWLAGVLGSWVRPRGGIVAGSNAKFAVDHPRSRPDLSLYMPGSARPPRRGVVHTPPDLMVEILSPHEGAPLDRIAQAHGYARFGVRHYWLIDPEARSFEALELAAGGKFERVHEARGGQVTLPGFELLVIDLDALWRETDKLLV